MIFASISCGNSDNWIDGDEKLIPFEQGVNQSSQKYTYISYLSVQQSKLAPT